MIGIIFGKGVALAGATREAVATFPGETPGSRSPPTAPRQPTQRGDFEIFTMHADGSELQQITENAAFDFDPGWT